MSVLETLFILFDADASGVKQGAKEAGKAIGELESKVKAVDLAATKLGQSFESLIGAATAGLAAFFSTQALVSGLTGAIADISAIGQSAEALGVEVETLDAWTNAVAAAGGNSEAFQQSLLTLKDHLDEVAATGKGIAAPALQRLGIQVRNLNGSIKTAPQLLLDLSRAFERLSKTESAALGKKLGLDAAVITLLQKGKQAVEEEIKKQKDFGTVTKEQTEIVLKYHEQVDRLTQIFKKMFMSVSTEWLPALTWLAKKFELTFNYLADHKELVIAFFAGVATVLTGLYLPAVIRAGIATYALIAPYLLVGAAVAAIVAAFALATEDIANFLDGNDSAIGEIAKRWPLVGDIVRGVVYIFEWLARAVNAVLKLLIDILDPTLSLEEAFDRYSKAFNAAFVKMLEKLPWLKNAITEVGVMFDAAAEIAKAAWHGVIEKIEQLISIATRAWQTVKSFLGLGNAFPQASAPQTGEALNRKALGAGKAAITLTNTPLAAQTSNSITHANRSVSKSTHVQTGPITVNAQNADANEVGQALSRGLGQELSAALNHFDDGVAG